MKKYIGVDIGGMSIKIGLVNEEGNLLAKTVVKTESDAESVIKTLGESLVRFLKENGLTEKDIEGVGLSWGDNGRYGCCGIFQQPRVEKRPPCGRVEKISRLAI